MRAAVYRRSVERFVDPHVLGEPLPLRLRVGIVEPAAQELVGKLLARAEAPDQACELVMLLHSRVVCDEQEGAR
jgi:hypothetical protein